MDKFKGKWKKFRKPYGPSLSGSSASTAASSISLAQNSNSQISTPILPATSQPQLKSSSSSVQSCALVADIPSQTTGSLSDIQFLSPSSTSRPCTPSLVTNNRIPPPLAAAATPAVQAPANDAALSIWDEAFSKVNDETQRWIRDYGLNLNSSEQAKSEDRIKELTDLLKSKTLFEDRNVPSKIEIGNQKIIFREYITDIVAFLTMAGDVAINFAPPQASAPWAAAKAVLNVRRSTHTLDDPPQGSFLTSSRYQSSESSRWQHLQEHSSGLSALFAEAKYTSTFIMRHRRI